MRDEGCLLMLVPFPVYYMSLTKQFPSFFAEKWKVSPSILGCGAFVDGTIPAAHKEIDTVITLETPMMQIGRLETGRFVRLWVNAKAWRHHITPVTHVAYPPFLKTSVFDDPVTCSIIDNTRPEVYCTFKAACSELKAANAVIDRPARTKP